MATADTYLHNRDIIRAKQGIKENRMGHAEKAKNIFCNNCYHTNMDGTAYCSLL